MVGRLSSFGFVLLALTSVVDGGGVELTSARAQPWRLPESIRRESLAAADRGRAFLRLRQTEDGLWRRDGAEGASPTAWPAMAFVGATGAADAAALQSAVAAAARKVERDAGRVLTPAGTVELACGVLLLRSVGTPREAAVARAERRLASISYDGFGAADAALVLEARAVDADTVGTAEIAWGTVIAKAGSMRRPAVGDVALAGVARLARGAAPDASAIRAHVHWLAQRKVLAPVAQDAWWVARFLEVVPPAVLHDEGLALDWRQRLAEPLVSRQRWDSATGTGYWDGGGTSADATLWETTFAVMTLLRLAE